MLKQCILIILFLCCTCVEKAGAQMVDGPYITWEDFVQSYLDPYQADNDTDTDVDLKERLEVLAQHPMQINLLGRDDLLQLPFITGEQADSLLSYRAKKHGFVSLGELQLIRGMDYYTRVYLSLFVRCEAAYPPTKEQLQRWKENDKITKKLFTGNHTIFGDKISPLSDTTVLASGGVGVPLFKHIRYMMITTFPSLLIALVIFTIAGFTHESTTGNEVFLFSAALSSRFYITPWLLLVPIITGIMIARRFPPVVTLFMSTLIAVVFALIFQPEVLSEIAEGNLFKGAMQSIYGSTSVSTHSPMLTSLVATRGMAGMMNTIWLIICAMCFGGAMEAGGMVRGITQIFVRMIHGRVSLVASTVCSGLMLNLAVADQYICILLTGNMFKKIYDRQGFEHRLLSRTTEDSVTVTSVLVPWNTCGMTQSTVLGVSTFTYLPYCFFNLISPLMSIFVATIGYKIFRTWDKR